MSITTVYTAKDSYSGSVAIAARRILLVEDHFLNREILSDYLQAYCGYNVLALSNGASFFSALDKFQPELVLLDLHLPDIDGYSLLQQMQADSKWKQMPVIVVSAFAFKDEQQKALSLGARKYLVKPMHLHHLDRAIQEELQCLNQ